MVKNWKFLLMCVQIKRIHKIRIVTKII